MICMIEKKREYLLGLGDLVNYRVWTSLIPSVMQGLASAASSALPTSVDDFVTTYHFSGPRDEENQGSGVTPLMLAALSGNLAVVNELISKCHVDVDARLQIDLHQFGAEKGSTALALSAGMCPESNVHDVVAALLAAGSNPNSASKQGTSPLMAAVVYQSLAGVRALLVCARGELDLEQELKANRATALSVASFAGSTAIVDALVEAGAKRKHIEDGGGNKLTDAASNPAADVPMLEALCRPDFGGHSLRDNINDPMRARTVKFLVIDFVCRQAAKLGAARSLLVMGRAHCQGSTPLHMAARAGNTNLCRWMLMNGARPSLHIRNKMGYLPIDLAGVFGPHFEVEGVLGAAIQVFFRHSVFIVYERKTFGEKLFHHLMPIASVYRFLFVRCGHDQGHATLPPTYD